jgi:hypothetical protein
MPPPALLARFNARRSTEYARSFGGKAAVAI